VDSSRQRLRAGPRPVLLVVVQHLEHPAGQRHQVQAPGAVECRRVQDVASAGGSSVFGAVLRRRRPLRLGVARRRRHRSSAAYARSHHTTTRLPGGTTRNPALRHWWNSCHLTPWLQLYHSPSSRLSFDCRWMRFDRRSIPIRLQFDRATTTRRLRYDRAAALRPK